MVANTLPKSDTKGGESPLNLLLEHMMLSDDDMKRLEEIVTHVADVNETFFHLNCIDYGRKGEHWILNYQQGAARNEYNRLCRGLIVHQPTGKIHSFPFARFFNFGEKDAVAIDLANAEIMEKMDGQRFRLLVLLWIVRKVQKRYLLFRTYA